MLLMSSWRSAAVTAGSAFLLFAFPAIVRADEVLEWDAVVQHLVISAPGVAQPRLAAIVHVSMFDAVNGIARQFTPIHVPAEAPPGASKRAAVAQAAYTALVKLFPSEGVYLDDARQASFARIASDAAIENSESIERGRMWGQTVAESILAWRETDGLFPGDPPFYGGTLPGQWRPTTPGTSMLLPSMAHTLPWVIPTPTSYRPPPPPALTSGQYTADFIEEKAVGELNSTVRTPDQTQAARFWAATALTFWLRAAAAAAVETHTTLIENARLFALLTMATADAAIAVWDSKVFYYFWRPITAIRLASTDGNPLTDEQADWTPLIVTPPYPDYVSGHAGLSGAAAAVLITYFGNDMPVEGTSEGLSGVVRS